MTQSTPKTQFPKLMASYLASKSECLEKPLKHPTFNSVHSVKYFWDRVTCLVLSVNIGV